MNDVSVLLAVMLGGRVFSGAKVFTSELSHFTDVWFKSKFILSFANTEKWEKIA